MDPSIQLGLALCAVLSFGCEARPVSSAETTATTQDSPADHAPSKTFGEAVPSGAAAQVAAILKEPSAYAGRDVVVAGTVRRACSKKGCWMELGPENDDTGPSSRVTFKDYGFFVPTDSAGKRARLVGQVATKTLSPAHAQHLEAEGARLAHKNDDGSAVEVQIVARGVELR